MSDECMHAWIHKSDLERCNADLDRLETENAKLRALVRQWYPHMLKRVGRDALEQWGQMEVVRELGVEVDG